MKQLTLDGMTRRQQRAAHNEVRPPSEGVSSSIETPGLGRGLLEADRADAASVALIPYEFCCLTGSLAFRSQLSLRRSVL